MGLSKCQTSFNQNHQEITTFVLYFYCTNVRNNNVNLCKVTKATFWFSQYSAIKATNIYVMFLKGKHFTVARDQSNVLKESLIKTPYFK